jgi:DNA-binding CsgD family transcriptional regulator
VIDDVHWADGPSLRWLAYLTRRIDGLRVAMLLGRRVGEPSVADEVLERIEAEPGVRKLEPGTLSESGVRAIIESAFGVSSAARLASACHDATGGNPFLLRELVAAIRSAGHDVDPASVVALASTDLTGAVRRRLDVLPDGSLALAEATATLGGRVELQAAAALAGLDIERAADLADMLVAAQILAPGRPLEFAHPLLRSAVEGARGTGARALAHRRGAQVLADSGAEPERVASQLLACEPAGDAWVVARLRDAATRSAARGAPGTAGQFLRRALAEPPAEAERTAVLGELGTVETRAGEPGGLDRLLAAYEEERDDQRRLAIVMGMAPSVTFADEPRAFEVLDKALPDFPPQRPELRAVGLGQSILIPAMYGQRVRFELLNELGELASTETIGGRWALGVLALANSWRGAPADVAAKLARRSIGDPVTLRASADRGRPMLTALEALVWADAGDKLEPLFGVIEESSSRRGSHLGALYMASVRALAALWQGNLHSAGEHAAFAFEGAPEDELVRIRRRALAVLVDLHGERGSVEEGEALLAREHALGELPPGLIEAEVSLARGRLRLAAGRPEQALADFERCRATCEATGIASVPALPWSRWAALAHLTLGDADGAAERAAEDLKAARAWEAPGALAAALRVTALVGPTEERLNSLRRAEGVLSGSSARLERAKTLVELGAEMRRRRQPQAAREPLADALEIADRCGAAALARRAREELLAAGARPRRSRRWGVDALTPSELRVARLAAQGKRNREIAQTLFVTPKTVEVHLSRCYRKLDVSGREQLAEALQGEDDGASLAEKT